jgi:creatinine amidohydrolase/Fe(II)-dependent formamide hydrolase-like protein
MMLHIAPGSVRMDLARKDFAPRQGVRLTRVKGSANTYSPTGAWDDATLATREKGETLPSAVRPVP